MALATRNLDANLKGKGQSERRKYFKALIVTSLITK
jgi:hypothetical protein